MMKYYLYVLMVAMMTLYGCGGGGGGNNNGDGDGGGETSAGENLIFLANQSVNSPSDYNLYHVNSDSPNSLTILNPPGTAVRGDVEQMKFSPDGALAVYRADQDTNGISELYLLHASSPPGELIKLNGALVAGGSVHDFAISPDSSRVVYSARQDDAGIIELYYVDIATPGVSIKLNSSLVAEGEISDFAISPDSDHVAYRADQDTDGIDELYMVDVSLPRTSIKLNSILVPDGDVLDFSISPDGNRVVYLADQETDRINELYSVDLSTPTPGTPVKLNGLLVAGGTVYDFIFSSDSAAVAYTATQDTSTVKELYGVMLATPGNSVKFNSPLVANGNISNFAFVPNTRITVYRADQETDEVYELFIVTAAETTTKLNSDLVSNGDVLDFFISPDGDVLYRADQDVDGSVELYLMVTPENTVKVNSELAAEEDVDQFAMTPDSSAVVYSSYDNSLGKTELYYVDLLDPGTSSKLNSSLTEGGDVREFAVCPDNNHVAYIADQETHDVLELFIVNVNTPGTSVKLNRSLPTGTYILEFKLSSDGTKALYRAIQDTDMVSELYLLDMANPGASVKLNGSMGINSDVRIGDFMFSPDDNYVVYRADQDTDEIYELYIVDITTPGTSIKLSDNMVPGGDVSRKGFIFSPDGSQVLYHADQDILEDYALYLVDVSAPGVSVKMSSAMDVDGDVGYGDFEFSPDGSRVVYLADQDTDGIDELYMVDVSLPRTSIKLNSILVPNGDVLDFSISPDGNRVVYLADQETDRINELFSVDLSTPTPGTPVKLNDALTENGDVQSFVVSPDNNHVMYKADQDIDDHYELYLVDLASPGTSVKLNSALISSDGENFPYRFNSDGSQVMYINTQDSADVYELYLVDVAVPGVSTKLNHDLLDGEHVVAVGFHPDNTYAAFVTYRYIHEFTQMGFYLVQLDQARTVTQLHTPRTGLGPDLNFGYFSFVPGEVIYSYEMF